MKKVEEDTERAYLIDQLILRADEEEEYREILKELNSLNNIEYVKGHASEVCQPHSSGNRPESDLSLGAVRGRSRYTAHESPEDNGNNTVDGAKNAYQR